MQRAEEEGCGESVRILRELGYREAEREDVVIKENGDDKEGGDSTGNGEDKGSEQVRGSAQGSKSEQNAGTEQNEGIGQSKDSAGSRETLKVEPSRGSEAIEGIDGREH